MKNLFVINYLTFFILLVGCSSQKFDNHNFPQVDSSFSGKISLRSSNIKAKMYNSSLEKIRISSDIWDDIPFYEVLVYPKTILTLKDKKEVQRYANRAALRIKVAAIYNDKEVLISVIWPDKSENIYYENCLESYGDGFSLKIINNGSKLPDIDNYSDNPSVSFFLNEMTFNHKKQNTDEEKIIKDICNDFKYNNLTISAKKQLKNESLLKSKIRKQIEKFKEKTKGGKIEISRIDDYGWMSMSRYSLKTDKQSLAISLSVWDGSTFYNDGLKLASAWIAVTLREPNPNLIKITEDKVLDGDIKNGQIQAIIHCAECHSFPDAVPPEYNLAPSLRNIGGHETADYIKEAILTPNAVIVRHENENIVPLWHKVDNDVKVSMMPSFDYLDKKTIKDLTAYFKTLKAKVTF